MPKTSDWPGASPIRATASPKIFDRFVRERVQASRRDIIFHLAVPGRGVEFGKPCPECVEFGRREPQNGLLDLIYTAHDLQLTVERYPRTTGGSVLKLL
jgi:hypothetical protein